MITIHCRCCCIWTSVNRHCKGYLQFVVFCLNVSVAQHAEATTRSDGNASSQRTRSATAAAEALTTTSRTVCKLFINYKHRINRHCVLIDSLHSLTHSTHIISCTDWFDFLFCSVAGIQFWHDATHVAYAPSGSVAASRHCLSCDRTKRRQLL